MPTRILIVYLDQPSELALDFAEAAIRKVADDAAVDVKRIGEDITISSLVSALQRERDAE